MDILQNTNLFFLHFLQNWLFFRKVPANKLKSSSSLSQAGKLTLIKSVLSSLPIYLCSTYKLPLTLCEKINAVSAGKQATENHCTGLISWAKISAYKAEGGLGIRDFRLLNQALLANQCWRLLNNPSSLLIS